MTDHDGRDQRQLAGPQRPRAAAQRPRGSSQLTRRGLLVAGTLGAAGLVASGAGTVWLFHRMDASPPVDVPLDDGGGEQPQGGTCVAASSLVVKDAIGGAALRYTDEATRSSYRFDADFHAQLVGWLGAWNRATGASVTAIETYGVFVEGNDNCHSWHAAGRAIDIARVWTGHSVQVSCRSDLWTSSSSAEQAVQRKRYWRLAASLHRHFAYVLTYHFDDRHHNHMHVDNSVSGGTSEFTTRSRVQNQAVQEICTQLWGRRVAISGSWDSATRSASRAVLDDLGRSGALTSGDNWHVFLDASMRRKV